MPTDPSAVTALLDRIRAGAPGARDELVALLYDRFRQRAHHRLRRERPGHSLATTDLANEALARLLQYDELARAANGHQLYRAFARALRQVLTDHARRRLAGKRGGGRRREELDDLADGVRRHSRLDVLALDEALRALAADHPREAEVLQMRFFGGHPLADIADALGVSLSTVERESRYGLAWLRAFLSPPEDP